MKPSIQIIVLQDGVEKINITDPTAAVINVTSPCEDSSKHKTSMAIYGNPKDVFFNHKELEREVQKTVMKQILNCMEDEDKEEPDKE